MISSCMVYLLCMIDKKHLMTGSKAGGTIQDIMVGKFEKSNVDQSSRRWDDNCTRCMVTYGEIIVVRRNINVGVGYIYLLPGE